MVQCQVAHSRTMDIDDGLEAIDIDHGHPQGLRGAPGILAAQIERKFDAVAQRQAGGAGAWQP